MPDALIYPSATTSKHANDPFRAGQTFLGSERCDKCHEDGNAQCFVPAATSKFSKKHRACSLCVEGKFKCSLVPARVPKATGPNKRGKGKAPSLERSDSNSTESEVREGLRAVDQ